jgi:hypothetical protein
MRNAHKQNEISEHEVRYCPAINNLTELSGERSEQELTSAPLAAILLREYLND